MGATKTKYHITYTDEDENEDVLEVSAYSREQALFISGVEDCVSIEEAVRRDRL